MVWLIADAFSQMEYTEGSRAMGDKGKKDKAKGQKQKKSKNDQQTQKKLDKQPKKVN